MYSIYLVEPKIIFKLKKSLTLVERSFIYLTTKVYAQLNVGLSFFFGCVFLCIFPQKEIILKFNVKAKFQTKSSFNFVFVFSDMLQVRNGD